MKKRGKILALAAIVVVGAVVLSRCGHKNTAVEYESRPTVRVENPVRQDISLYTDLTGLVIRSRQGRRCARSIPTR